MGSKIFKIISPMVLMLFFLLSGCQSLENAPQKPDRVAKWRAFAEASKGRTPDLRQFATQPSSDNQGKKKKINPQPLELKQAPPKAPAPAARSLPTMPITMKMHDVSVVVVLRTLARAADMNMMINETVTGKANLNIKNMPWNQVFTGFLSTYGLTYKWSGEVLRIITVEDLNKEIALMEAAQKFEKSKKEHAIAMLAIKKEEEKLEPLFTEVIKINYADLSSLRDNIETYLLASKKDIEMGRMDADDRKKTTQTNELRGSILMDANSNALIIQATKSDIQKIIPIIEKLDRPTHQILLEAHIVEVNSDTAKELGIQWGGLGLSAGGTNTWIGGGPLSTFDNSLVAGSDGTQAGSAITHLPGIGTGVNFPSSESAGTQGWNGMNIGLMTENPGKYLLYAQLTALQEEGKLNILSRPSVTTMDHRKATIESGKEVPFQTIEDDEVKIEFKKAVIKLEVVPHVIGKEKIRLEILTHKDELDWTHTVAGNPTIITKKAQTHVYLYDGQTTVIGGLNKEKIQESEAGVPYLKDIPGLGVLFRSNAESSDMEELFIFITPHILSDKAAVPAKEAMDRYVKHIDKKKMAEDIPAPLGPCMEEYRAKDTDTLWEIARELFGSGRYYPVLMACNPDLNIFTINRRDSLKYPCDKTRVLEIYRQITAVKQHRRYWKYTVRPGDTPRSVADRYCSDKNNCFVNGFPFKTGAVVGIFIE